MASLTLQVEGPLSRPPARRRRVNIALSFIPEALRAAFLAPIKEASEQTITVGRRVLQILWTAPQCGVVLQLTRQYVLAQRVERYVKWLEEGIESLPEAFVLYDAEDRLLITNPQYAQLYPTIADLLRPGVTFREISISAVARGQFRHPEGAEAWLNRRIEFHDRGEGFFEQHLNNGRWIQLSERRTRSGGITSIRADITLLKDREEALRREMFTAESKSRSMARFLAIFSHEVRNGLNGVAGLAQTLALDAQSPSQRSQTQLMLRSTRRLTAVLADLLDYLKNEAIGVAVTHGTVDLRNLLETLRGEIEPQAAQRGIALRWETSEAVPTHIKADSCRILQVLANLVGNALKHGQRGAVTVRSGVVNGKLRFEVEDQGVGISQEELRSLFEYFVQAKPHRSSGTGLGLAICKQLVIAMGGEIGAQSETGRGSCFWFDLPLLIALPPLTKPPSNPPLSGAHVALRVGIIDDDPLNRTVAQALVIRLGHEALVFDDGLQIVDSVKQGKLDVLLLDLMIPQVSGFDIATALRQQEGASFEKLVLIALTGNVVPDSLAACRAAGFNAILQKPLFLDRLQHVLNWAATAEQPFSADGPEVFNVSPVVDTGGSSVVDAHSALALLAKDVSGVRFAQIVRAARKLFKQAMHVSADAPGPLRHIAHRVAGTAAQMGLRSLSDCALQVDTLLGATETMPPPAAGLEALLTDLRRTAAESLLLLDTQLRRMKVRSSASGR